MIKHSPKLMTLRNLKLEIEKLEINPAEREPLASLVKQVVAGVKSGTITRNFWEKISIIKTLVKRIAAG